MLKRIDRLRTCRDLPKIWLSLGLLAVLSQAPLLPRAFAADEKDTSESQMTLPSADGWPLKLTYYKSSEGRESPVVILLHGKGENRLAWTNPDPKMNFAKTLQGAGYAVIALDLRKHGQSKPGETDSDPATKDSKDKSAKKSGSSDLKPADYQAMLVDLAVVKKFVYEEHQKENLNMRKTAIVSSTMSAALAVIFAADDWAKKPHNDASTLEASTPRGQDIQTLIFLSPDTTVPGLQAHAVAPALKQRPITSLVFVAKGDKQDAGQAKKLFQQMGGDIAQSKKAEPKKADAKDKDKSTPKDEIKEKRFLFLEVPGALRGADLLGKKLGVEKIAVDFLNAHLKSLNSPQYEWRDRKSKLAD